jgi:dihydrofolate synthase/folylpolyglutamate synthase
VDIAAAIAWLESHTNLEGDANKAGERAASAASMPIAGAINDLSLAPMIELLGLLGDPHLAYRTIHVTGTNGKGSTASYITRLLAATELSVGLYTSPNLERINERIVWDGRWIPDEDLARILTLLRDVLPLMVATPSRFELLTAAAFVYFAEVGADVAVIEVGLLGRFDATNVIDADVAVITNIGKDHTDGIGDWQVKVAREKAGIIKPPSHVVLGSPFGELRSVIDGEESAAVWELGTDVEILANELGVGGRIISVSTPLGVYDDIFLPVFGEHQGSNLATALAATDAFFGRPLDRDLVDAALAEIELPGRFEVVSREPTVILDGGHNPDGLAVVKQTLDEAFARIGSWVLVLGFLGGKDPAEMLEAVDAADFDAVIVCTPSWSRAIPAEVVASAAARIGVDVEIVADPVEAFRRARAVSSDEDLILVTGSMYIVGNVRSVARSLAESPAFED